MFQKEITIPSGTGAVGGANASYDWTYNIKNVTGTYLTTTTTSDNLTVYAVSIDDCSVNAHHILDATLYDEADATVQLNGTIELELTISSLIDPTVNWNYSTSVTSNFTNISVCVPDRLLNYTEYSIDATMSYVAPSYVQEFYYIYNGRLSSACSFNGYTSCNVNLYDLLGVDSTTFLFTFTDSSGLKVPDATVHVFRKYIGEGLFREVERSQQDSNGESHVHLVEEDVIYYFMITDENGNNLYTSSTYNAKCLSSPCSILLEATADTQRFPTDWDLIDDTSYAVTQNATTRTTTLSFTSNSTTNMSLQVYKYDNGQPLLINGTSVQATAGAMSLHIPMAYGNTTFFAAVYKDGTFVKSQWIDFAESGQTYFGMTGVILAAVILLAVILMAVSEGAMMVLMSVVVLLLLGISKLIDYTWMGLVAIIVAGFIIMYKLSQRGGS
jgi:hypothetical protein